MIGVRPKTCRLAGMPPESSLYSMSVSAASACLCITTSCIAMRGVRVPRLLAAPLKKLPCSCTRLHNAGLLESPVCEQWRQRNARQDFLPASSHLKHRGEEADSRGVWKGSCAQKGIGGPQRRTHHDGRPLHAADDGWRHVRRRFCGAGRPRPCWPVAALPPCRRACASETTSCSARTCGRTEDAGTSRVSALFWHPAIIYTTQATRSDPDRRGSASFSSSWRSKLPRSSPPTPRDW